VLPQAGVRLGEPREFLRGLGVGLLGAAEISSRAQVVAPVVPVDGAEL